MLHVMPSAKPEIKGLDFHLLQQQSLTLVIISIYFNVIGVGSGLSNSMNGDASAHGSDFMTFSNHLATCSSAHIHPFKHNLNNKTLIIRHSLWKSAWRRPWG